MLDERTQDEVEGDLRGHSFATNQDLSLAFTGEDEQVDEKNPYSYLLDLPRSLSLSEKWRRLEGEVKVLMAEYTDKLKRTVWDEWREDVVALKESVEAFMT